ncbi:MAG: MFS transporter, partial [Candidatus Dormibacteraeota bacterium]|nr:MFS transporter [Candidatus Dormibacteraeota bacterium]
MSEGSPVPPPASQAAPPAAGATASAATSIPWTPQLVRVMAGLMLCIFVAAMDSTVVGTALPTISRDLNGFSLYSWVFAGYLLTGTTSVPIWGRLADLYGRRRVLLAGLAIFVIASLLCGASTSMVALILFRTLQGVGAGCLQPVTITVIGDIFPLAQRARLQGLFSAMWAVAAITGPLLGALFVSTVGWRWIFGINLPIGIAAALLLRGYHEKHEQRAQGGLDLPGAAALTVGVALLLWGLGAGNTVAQPVVPALVAAAVILAVFFLIERRSSGPTIPLALLRRRSIGPPMLVALLAGTVMFGATAYVPLFVQGALGGSTYQAGAAVAPMSLGWPVASVISGRLLLRVGFRWLALAGALLLVLGAVMLAVRPPGGGVLWVGLGSAVIGAGLGTISTPVLIVIQSSVPWDQRGSATALNQFSRTIGGAVGVAGMGILLVARLKDEAVRLGLPPAATANPLNPGAGAVA